MGLLAGYSSGQSVFNNDNKPPSSIDKIVSDGNTSLLNGSGSYDGGQLNEYGDPVSEYVDPVTQIYGESTGGSLLAGMRGNQSGGASTASNAEDWWNDANEQDRAEGLQNEQDLMDRYGTEDPNKIKSLNKFAYRWAGGDVERGMELKSNMVNARQAMGKRLMEMSENREDPYAYPLLGEEDDDNV